MGITKKTKSPLTYAFVGCFVFIACLIQICFATGSVAKEKAAPKTPSVETLHPESKEDIHHLLSELSDEQVRQILIKKM